MYGHVYSLFLKLLPLNLHIIFSFLLHISLICAIWYISVTPDTTMHLVILIIMIIYMNNPFISFLPLLGIGGAD